MIDMVNSNAEGTHAVVTRAGSGVWQSRSKCRNSSLKSTKLLLQNVKKKTKKIRNALFEICAKKLCKILIATFDTGGCLGVRKSRYDGQGLGPCQWHSGALQCRPTRIF